MNDINKTIAEIRRRADLPLDPSAAVKDRRTLLNITLELQNYITELEGLIECENPHCDMACHEA